jgi:cytochrome c551/c552
VPTSAPAQYADRGAVGLLVPGAGATVTRASALASLERGKTLPALLGGMPHGQILVEPASSPGTAVTIYVSLPPPGRSSNHRRYPIAVVGCGFHGLLTSTETRLAGLISIADIAPAAVRLGRGCRGAPLGWRASADAPAELHRLDRRIARVHDARGWTAVGVLVTIVLLGLVGSPAVVGCVAAVAASLVLSALGVESFWALVLGVAGITTAVALATPLRRIVPVLLAAFLVAFLCVLALDTRLNTLAVLGARPDGGGRFFGLTNQVETLLLPPMLVAAAADGLPWLLGIGVLALVTVGWSHAGADGGGLVVYAAALAVLGLRVRGIRLTPRVLASLCAAFVGLDAALGGSSHVTHAVGTGPGSLLGDLGRRLHLSYLSVTSSRAHGIEFAVAITALVAFASFSYRRPLVQAFLFGIAVSFVVNDTPVDVAYFGALGCWALARWESVDSRAMRRPVVLFASAFAVLALAGCGSEGAVRPLPDTVVGTLKQAAPGKGLFDSNGCNGCHTYAPAGAHGTVGPDLDKLPQYAQKAKQPLDTFVEQSIVDPNAYVEKGYPKGVMPSFKQLSPADLKALVDFLTKPQG